MANIFHVERAANKITLGTTGTTINIASHTASKLLALDASKDLEVVTIGTSLDYVRPTLNTIQDIRTTANPTFNNLTLTGGLIVPVGSGLSTPLDGGDEWLWAVVGCDAGGEGYCALVLDGGVGGDTSGSIHFVNDTGAIIGFFPGNIWDSTGTINFDDENLSTTGTITASNYTAVNLLTACVTNAGTLDFSAAGKTLTIEDNAIVSQDYSTDASPTFAGLNLTGNISLSSGASWILLHDSGTNVGHYLLSCDTTESSGYGEFSIWRGTGPVDACVLGDNPPILWADSSFNVRFPNDVYIGCSASSGNLIAHQNIGIRTTTPDAPLHIIADLSANNIRLEENSGGQYWQLAIDVNGGLKFRDEGTTKVYFQDTTGKVHIGGVSPKTLLTIEGALTLKEQAAANADTADYGQIWAKTATPNELWFTNDAGTDLRIAPQDLQTTASPLFARLNIQENTTSGTIDSGWGQIWVKNDVPTTLWFRDDTGVDHQIAFV